MTKIKFDIGYKPEKNPVRGLVKKEPQIIAAGSGTAGELTKFFRKTGLTEVEISNNIATVKIPDDKPTT